MTQEAHEKAQLHASSTGGGAQVNPNAGDAGATQPEFARLASEQPAQQPLPSAQDAPKTVAFDSPFHDARPESKSPLASDLAFIQNVATRGFVNYLKNIIPHLRRVLRGNLAGALASTPERVFLEDACEVRGQCAQSYMVWRRSAMVLMIVPLGLTALFSIIGAFLDIYELSQFVPRFKEELAKLPVEQLHPALASEMVSLVEESTEPMIAGVTMIKLLSIVAIVISFSLAVLALHFWSRHKLSRRFLLASWTIGFLLPFLISLLPIRLLLAEVDPPSHVLGMPIDPSVFKELMSRLELEIGLGYGLYMFVILAPAVLTIFPAMIRAGLYTKTLLPQSPVPGWVSIVVPVFYVMLIFAFFALLNQMAGDVLMLLGLLLLAASPLAYLLKAKQLAAPLAPEEVFPAVRGVRILALSLALAAAVVLLVFVFNSPLIEALEFVSPFSLLQMSVDFVAKYFLMTLVGCDLLVRLLTATRNLQLDNARARSIREGLSERLNQLTQLED